MAPDESKEFSKLETAAIKAQGSLRTAVEGVFKDLPDKRKEIVDAVNKSRVDPKSEGLDYSTALDSVVTSY